MKRLLVTVGLCFVAGIVLARAIGVAHATKCDPGDMVLTLDAIEGDADPTLEQDFWSDEATIINGHLCLQSGEPGSNCLRLQP